MGLVKMYNFSRNFANNLLKNTGIVLTEDNAAYIKSICKNTEPYRKIDNKETLVTLVCDADKKLIVTCIIETHDRPQFRKK